MRPLDLGTKHSVLVLGRGARLASEQSTRAGRNQVVALEPLSRTLSWDGAGFRS